MIFFTEGKQRDYGLDVLRAIAIIAVVFYHYPKHETQMFFRAIFHFGYWGVDLFFVLSGFLIGGQCFRAIKKTKSFSIKKFYIRRFLRTLPNYYVYLFLVILIEGYSSSMQNFDWRYLFFLQNIGGLYYQTHTWSLCIEEHFYLLFPIVVVSFSKIKSISLATKILGAVVLVGVLVRLVLWLIYRPDLMFEQNIDQAYDLYFKHIYYPSYNRIDGLMFGVFLAYVQTYFSQVWQGWAENKGLRNATIGIAVIGVSVCVGYFKVQWWSSIFSFPLVSVGFSCLLLASQDKELFINKIKTPGITFISILSYSLYLTHIYAFDFADYMMQSLGWYHYGIMAAILRCFVVILSATVMFAVVEKPFLYIRKMMLLRIIK